MRKHSTKDKDYELWSMLAESLICTINAAEGVGDFALNHRLRTELAQVVYDHLTAKTFYAVATKCGWEWERGTGPLTDVANTLGISIDAVIEVCGNP